MIKTTTSADGKIYSTFGAKFSETANVFTCVISSFIYTFLWIQKYVFVFTNQVSVSKIYIVMDFPAPKY